MVRSLADHDGYGSNDFQLLRTIAALAVIVSHAFALASGVADDEPFNKSGWTPGACAVIVFFAMSGFLIAGSVERRPGFGAFAAARARRIFPAYLIALVLVVAVLGGAATTLRLPDYYAHPATWDFVLRHAVFETSLKGLPGVFASNPHPWTVNGSLWSLPLEVLCYFLLYGAARLRLLGRAHGAWFLAAGIGCSAVMRVEGVGGTLPHVLPSFVTGAALYVYRAQVPASGPLLGALLCLSWAGAGLPLHDEMARMVIAYGAIVVATGSSAPGRLVARGGDYSYGLYLYGWPATQAVVWAIPGISVGPLLAAVLPCAGALAVASWHWIERPALAPRRREAHALRTASA